MANQLTMAKVHSILTLHQRGWSNRRIARALGIHRKTVGRYVRLFEKGRARAGMVQQGVTPICLPAFCRPVGAKRRLLP